MTHLIALLSLFVALAPQHHPVPDQQEESKRPDYVLRVNMGEGEARRSMEFAIDCEKVGEDGALSLATPARDGFPGIRLKRLLTNAEVQREVLPREGGSPAIEILVTGSRGTSSHWMLSDRPMRNRLKSIIATWTYARAEDPEVRDKMLAAVKEAGSKRPTLEITTPGAKQPEKLLAEKGLHREIPPSGARIEVLRFFPHFMSDPGGEPFNASDKMMNPAAQVRITLAGKTEDRWIFARFPEKGAMTKENLPVDLKLDCPSEGGRTIPGFAIVKIGAEEHELWTRFGDDLTVAPLDRSATIEISGSNYSFRTGRIVKAGELIESYRPSAAKSGGVAALEVEFTGKDEKGRRIWLRSGHPAAQATSLGDVTLLFFDRRATIPDRPPMRGSHP